MHEIALADIAHSRKVSFPAFGFRRATLEHDRRRALTHIHGAAGVVIGMPVPQAHQSCDELQRFIAAYSALLLRDAPVHAAAFWDESYTSSMAAVKIRESRKRGVRRDLNKRKRLVDAVRSRTPRSM